MRKASYVHALVVLSACGSGGHGQPILLDAGGDAEVGVDASGTTDAGGTADTGTIGGTDGGVAHCSRFTFSTASPKSFPTGLGPNSLAVNDVNKDGKLDLVAANDDDNTGPTISVLLGNGDGTFKPKADRPAGAGDTAVTVVDVNKDGNPDILVPTQGSRTVSVLLGSGNGTFQPKPDVHIDQLPAALAAGDVDHDGKVDLVIAAGGSLDGVASVFRGNGDGTFQSNSFAPTGGFPNAIALADVNNDGDLDIVVTNANDTSGVVSVFLGLGNATFQDGVDNPLGGLNPVASALAVGDVNGDGKLDIVVADSGDTSRAVVFLGNGDGTFQGGVGFPVGQMPMGLAIADVTGDGKPDIVTIGLQAQAISVLAGNGDGTFQDKVDTVVGSFPVALAVTDLNGDGMPDVIVADQSPGSAIVLLGQCAP